MGLTVTASTDNTITLQWGEVQGRAVRGQDVHLADSVRVPLEPLVESPVIKQGDKFRRPGPVGSIQITGTLGTCWSCRPRERTF